MCRTPRSSRRHSPSGGSTGAAGGSTTTASCCWSRPAGEAVGAAAKASGTWTALDAVEALVEPDELRAALDADADARRHWDAFPPSTKRAILQWIADAKRPETLARRVEDTARLAAENVRARG